MKWKNIKCSKFIAPALLFLGGLVHLLPDTLTPLAELGLGFVTIQRIVGFISIATALYMIFMPGQRE